MKKAAILILLLICLTACSSIAEKNLQETDAKEDKQIRFYVHYIDFLKYHEHTRDTIYSLHFHNNIEQGVSINKTNICENKTTFYLTVNEAKTLEDINDIKVSNNNQYMAITFNEANGKKPESLQIIKLKDLAIQEKLRDISNYKLYEYELVDFIENDGLDIDLTNNEIHLSGFTEDGKALWGAVGTRIDVTYPFLINIETGEIDFLKDQESYNKASENNKVAF